LDASIYPLSGLWGGELRDFEARCGTLVCSHLMVGSRILRPLYVAAILSNQMKRFML